MFLGQSAIHLKAKSADFILTTSFQRNPKIWGTYKLNKEKIFIKRGKRKWRRKTKKRTGDIIISKGNLIFVREVRKNGKTKLVVEKFPYNKAKKKFIAKNIDKNTISRLFEKDIKATIPHKDLLEGEIKYKSIECNKKKGSVYCSLKGKLTPLY